MQARLGGELACGGEGRRGGGVGWVVGCLGADDGGRGSVTAAGVSMVGGDAGRAGVGGGGVYVADGFGDGETTGSGGFGVVAVGAGWWGAA